MLETLWQQLQSNAFLSGGLVLGAAGIVITYLRRLPQQVYNFIKRKIITELSIPDKDQAFDWLDLWLSKHNYAQKRCRLWSVITKRATDGSNRAPSILLVPGPGIHFLFYKKRFIILNRERKDGDKKSGMKEFTEEFHLTLFSRNRQIVTDLLEESRKLAYPVDTQVLRVYKHSNYEGGWVERNTQSLRPLDSVILPPGHIETLLEDVKKFLNSGSKYTAWGIPYRRGYLFYGTPGSGKTSLIVALASHLELDIYCLSLANPDLTDSNLLDALTEDTKGSLILIEDIDCVFKKREKAEEKGVTFSGLLNAIDGVTASHGRLLFVTTNHREVLDPALLRAGRLDVQVEFKNATNEQAKQLFLKFFPDFPARSNEFANNCGSYAYSMADIQSHLLKYQENVDLALTNQIFEV